MPLDQERPSEARKPAWRAACLAYRAKLQAGASDDLAPRRSRGGQEVWPGLSWAKASAEAVNAVSFASAFHEEWLRSGIGSPASEKISK